MPFSARPCIKDVVCMNLYTLNEETPKAVCTLNSKGEKKEEKEEGRRRKERGEMTRVSESERP